MPIDRRTFLGLAAGGVMASATRTPLRAQTPQPRFRAIAFDAFPIFDPRPVVGLADTLFQGKGTELVNAWRTRQFEYQWLRALAGHYADFWQTTEDALVFAGKLLHLEVTSHKRAQLMDAYLTLKVWPDVLPALSALREARIRLAFLSNMTGAMLNAGIRDAGLHGMFEQVLSTDQIKTYKPDPRAYRLAVDALHLPPEEIIFAAFAGWDACGAKWFGYPEELGLAIDATGQDLNALVSFTLNPVRA
jgi:2-haloacid dehalogenase